MTYTLPMPRSTRARSLASWNARILGALLLGYMFFGRGFAHIGLGPLYVGDWVMLFCLASAAAVAYTERSRLSVSLAVVLLVAFGVWGAVRTLPFLQNYGLDALRDASLWGYAAFAFITYASVDRSLARSAIRWYGYVVPVFALWLPISWNIAARLATSIDPSRPGETIPFVFFKGGDMAVHVVGSTAFLVLATGRASFWSFLWRTAIALPLWWTVFVAGTSNRGALLTTAVGMTAIGIAGVILGRSRNWLPLGAAAGLLAAVLGVQAAFGSLSAGASPRQPIGSAAHVGSSSASPSAAETSLSKGQLSLTASPNAFSSDGPAESPSTERALIANADFEVGPTDAGFIVDWAGGPGVEDTSQGDAHHGFQYASLENTLGPYRATLTSSRFAAPGAKDIEVSVWSKAIRGRPTLEVYVNWYDASNSLINNTFVNLLATEGSPAWQRCLGYAPAPAQSRTAEIVLYEATGGATIGIDDVAVEFGDFAIGPTSPNAPGRPATFGQLIDNFLSLFGSSPDGSLEGTKQFRLAWWGTIVDYTVFGEYFWTGKGFGINLADADGFQSTSDGSLRAPHNSHMTVLARMGVPGLGVWMLLQLLWVFGVIRASLGLRHNSDQALALLGGCLVVYWVAMMVNTSFDPYLEGPQGGIWFWTVFGLGLALMNFRQRPSAA